MSDKGQKEAKIEDEPGAEDRFLRGVNKALNTPPKPYTPAKDKPKKGKGRKEGSRG